jgi:hypothetical protein
MARSGGPLMTSFISLRCQSEWIERERPDAIIGQHSALLEWPRGIGLRVPEDIGGAHLALDDDCAPPPPPTHTHTRLASVASLAEEPHYFSRGITERCAPRLDS